VSLKSISENRRAVSIVIGVAFAAYGAGEHGQYLLPPVKQVASITVASSTTSALSINATTLQPLAPARLIVPPSDRQQQG
jgi:hypothetical protein